MPVPGANAIREVFELPTMIFEKGVDVPLKDGGLVRANVYRPLIPGKYPVIMTYGPYGANVPYSEFHVQSYREIPDEQKSEHSAWEVPHPEYWVSQGYVVVRIDERGIGASPGFLDTMSDQTSSDFAECIEWAADQPWSTGKIGLLGISYYGGSYRDRVRHGGILSNNFIHFWWSRQVVTMQYGNSKKAVRAWGPSGPVGKPFGPECLEGTLTEEELVANRNDQTIDNHAHRYLDEPYHASRVYELSQIEVPVLSVANLGGIMLHLRGNVVGYEEAGTKNKWLYFISGRHDLPFYLPQFVKVQKSFLDAWLKDDDPEGWKLGPNVKVPAVSLLLRKGNPGFNSNEAEATFKSRPETSWPIERTKYTKFFLHPSTSTMSTTREEAASTLALGALGAGDTPTLSFRAVFDVETEVAGHVVAHLAASVEALPGKAAPKDMDLFLTLRHLDSEGKEVFYTGTAGDPVPLCKGWLRASLRAVDESNSRHKDYLPHRNYTSKDVELLQPKVVYDLLVEMWPTAVIVSPGGSLVLEVATADTQGSGIFRHDDPDDRSVETFGGMNLFHFGPDVESWLQLPLV
ncbi:hypothetical protein RQP46_010897 [Phenoliferia psychrophenolica]